MKFIFEKIFQEKGFTLIELLLGVAILGILGTVIFTALDPSRRFAESRNAQRWSEVRTILDAIFLYNADHGEFPPGIDDSMKMIGSASSGCAATCSYVARIDMNQEYQDNFFARFFYFASIGRAQAAPAIEWEKPRIIYAEVEPQKVRPGDVMAVWAEIEDGLGVRSVTADMGGIETINLDLSSGDEYRGVWQTEWRVHGTEIKDYTTVITATNQMGESETYEVVWSDPPATGWISPTGHSDPGNQWTTEVRAYDGNSSSYASNTYGGSGWGQFLVLTMATSTLSDRLRVKADYQDSIIQEVDIDIYTGGSWVDVFQGGDEATWNGQFVEITYPKSNITQVRFRYNYSAGGYYYWLYELEVYQASAVITLPSCSSYPATAVQRTAAVLHATVADDGGEPCEARFRYGETQSYGYLTGWDSSFESGVLVSKLVTGLDYGTTYHFQGQLRNSSGTVDCPDTEFTTKVVDIGWVLPTGYTDPASAWVDEDDAFDDTINSFASQWHAIGDPVWGDYIYFTHEPMASDKLRFWARGGSEVGLADVDVYRDGAWVDVYDGAVNNLAWTEVVYDQGIINQARIRFSAAYTNRGFNWELYEFQFYKYTATSEGECLDIAPYLVSDYLPVLPVDPLIGTEERTYYGVKLESDNSLRVVACHPELNEVIEIRR